MFFTVTPVWSSAVIALSMATSVAQDHQQRPDFQTPLPSADERAEGPAGTYANLSPSDCRRRLKTADTEQAFVRQGGVSGVATSLRFDKPLGNVEFQAPPARTLFGLLDCRQALLWLELADVLSDHNVAKVRIDNFYRPGARLGRRGKSQHAYGLAADVVSFTLKDGTVLDVEEDFHGKRGEPPCGPKAQLHLPSGADNEDVARALHLRNLVCAMARGGWFHHILTPNYNRAHRDHLHLDIKRDNDWFSVD